MHRSGHARFQSAAVCFGSALGLVLGLALTGCSSSDMSGDAGIACGWDEAVEPIVAAADATPEQLARNADRAEQRLAAARRVVEQDERFAPLAEALEETSNFADELTKMDRTQIQAIGNERWDFAKYAQAVARDQCEQLAAVVGRE